VSARAPRISVVIPVLHEADWIDGVIAHTRGLPGGGDCEVIVVDGDPAGDTLAAVAQTGVTGMRAERGRSRQMNAGAAAARGEVLLFLHADTFLPPSAFADVAACLADPACDGGAFRHRFDSPRTVYRLMSALVTLRSRWTRLPFGDQAIFLRRAFFESIGGFAPIPVMEDVELVRRIRRRGGASGGAGAGCASRARPWSRRGAAWSARASAGGWSRTGPCWSCSSWACRPAAWRVSTREHVALAQRRDAGVRYRPGRRPTRELGARGEA
jgi:rSAM/selenodomain-associated transferase 2